MAKTPVPAQVDCQIRLSSPAETLGKFLDPCRPQFSASVQWTLAIMKPTSHRDVQVNKSGQGQGWALLPGPWLVWLSLSCDHNTPSWKSLSSRRGGVSPLILYHPSV